MLSSVSASEMRQWESYWMEEPFGQIRQDHVLAALIQAVISSFSSEPVTFDYVLNHVLPQYSLPTSDDSDAAIKADLARVEAWKLSGKVVDMRGKKKKDVA